MADDYDALVVDLGAQTTRIGLAGNNLPDLSIRSVIGTPHEESSALFSSSPTCLVSSCLGAFAPKPKYIGDEVQQHRYYLSLRYPVLETEDHGWNNQTKSQVEELLTHALLTRMKYNMETTPMLVSQPIHCGKLWRHGLAELAYGIAFWSVFLKKNNSLRPSFETFGVPGFESLPAGLLGVYATGRTCCNLVDIGHHHTSITPVFGIYP